MASRSITNYKTDDVLRKKSKEECTITYNNCCNN